MPCLNFYAGTFFTFYWPPAGRQRTSNTGLWRKDGKLASLPAGRRSTRYQECSHIRHVRDQEVFLERQESINRFSRRTYFDGFILNLPVTSWDVGTLRQHDNCCIELLLFCIAVFKHSQGTGFYAICSHEGRYKGFKEEKTLKKILKKVL